MWWEGCSDVLQPCLCQKYKVAGDALFRFVMATFAKNEFTSNRATQAAEHTCAHRGSLAKRVLAAQPQKIGESWRRHLDVFFGDAKTGNAKLAAPCCGVHVTNASASRIQCLLRIGSDRISITVYKIFITAVCHDETDGRGFLHCEARHSG